MKGRNAVKIDFVLTGELASKLDETIGRGIASSKPEAVRMGLNLLFDRIERQDLTRARLRRLENV